MMQSHRCLEQLLIPDARMNGATLRFWEAQYDVLIGGSLNMMNSPHGWTAWLIPRPLVPVSPDGRGGMAAQGHEYHGKLRATDR